MFRLILLFQNFAPVTRSLVEDRFLSDRSDKFDPIFSDLDLDYRDSFKRGLFSHDIPNDLSQAQDGVSLFLFNEKSDVASSPFPAPRISRFVNLGGFQSQSNPVHFFEQPRNSDSGVRGGCLVVTLLLLTLYCIFRLFCGCAARARVPARPTPASSADILAEAPGELRGLLRQTFHILQPRLGLSVPASAA